MHRCIHRFEVQPLVKFETNGHLFSTMYANYKGKQLDLLKDAPEHLKTLDTALQLLATCLENPGKVDLNKCAMTLQNAKKAHADLSELVQEGAEKTIHLQTSLKQYVVKIMKLEATISQLKTEISELKADRAKSDERWETQIGDLEQRMEESNQRVLRITEYVSCFVVVSRWRGHRAGPAPQATLH